MYNVKNLNEENESSGKPRNKLFFTSKIVTHQHFLLPSFFQNRKIVFICNHKSEVFSM